MAPKKQTITHNTCLVQRQDQHHRRGHGPPPHTDDRKHAAEDTGSS